MVALPGSEHEKTLATGENSCDEVITNSQNAIVLRQLENKELIKWQVAATERLMSNSARLPSLDKARAVASHQNRPPTTNRRARLKIE